MTVQRYAEIMSEYGISTSHFPTDEQLKDMTEEKAHEIMRFLSKVFDKEFSKDNKGES